MNKPAPDGRIPKTVFTLDDISKAAEMGRQAGMIDALAELVKQEPVAVVEITYGREPECYVTGNIDDFPEGVFKLYAGPVSVEAAVLAERDACAKVCDDYAAKCAENENWEAEDVSLINAAAIRARGEK